MQLFDIVLHYQYYCKSQRKCGKFVTKSTHIITSSLVLFHHYMSWRDSLWIWSIYTARLCIKYLVLSSLTSCISVAKNRNGPNRKYGKRIELRTEQNESNKIETSVYRFRPKSNKAYFYMVPCRNVVARNHPTIKQSLFNMVPCRNKKSSYNQTKLIFKWSLVIMS